MAYQPASNTTLTPSITHLATVFYNRTGLDRLTKRFVFRGATMPDSIPQRSGKLVQWYRYGLFAANTTASSEGTVSTGLPLTTSTITATISEYSDFISISRLLKNTAIDDVMANASRELGYRAGITADTITRTEFDSNVSSTSVGGNTMGSAFAANDIRRAVMLLEGSDVRPMRGSDFVGVIHPYVLYDLESDNTAGGFIDVMKYANANVLVDGGTAMDGEAGKIAGCRLLKSTNVGSTGSAPSTRYYTYIVGEGAVGAVSLAGNAPTDVTNPDAQAFSINTIPGGPGPADPEGMIGGWVSYYFTFVAKTLDTSTYRYRIILADSSII